MYFSFNYRKICGRTSMSITPTERRNQTRKRVFRAAQIAVTEKAPKLDCAVRDISEQGARLSVSTTFGLPQQFDVIIDGRRMRGRSIWRTYTELGVTFI
jgi:hypothetical protein